MLRAHRQAWCWQDEYYGLTMDDIRRLERETQVHLAEKMAAAKAAAAEGGEATPVATTPTNTATTSPAKQPASEGDVVHCVEQGAIEGEGGGEKAEEVKGYSRSISRESRGSTSTIVNGGKGVRQSRNRASGEIAFSLVWATHFSLIPQILVVSVISHFCVVSVGVLIPKQSNHHKLVACALEDLGVSILQSLQHYLQEQIQGHYLQAQIQGHHATDHLDERGVERGSTG